MILAWRTLCSIALAALLSGLQPIYADENETHDAMDVVIEGVEDELLLKNVRAYLDIAKLPKDKPLPSESRLRWLHARAEKQVLKALEPFGYYRANVESELNQTATGWKAVYRIDLGSPILISKLDLQILGQGAQDPSFQALLDRSSLAVGLPLRHAPYETLKQALQTLSTERGYFDARLKVNEIQVDLDTYKATVALHLDTGDRYRFGDINFDQDTLSPDFLNRYIDIRPGDFYAASALLKLQSDLINSEYFSQVEVNASPDKAEDKTLPVDVALELRKKRKYTVGLGYGTDSGVRGRGGMRQRWVNRRGHHYRLDLLASEIRYSFTGEYTIPGKDPRSDFFALRTGFTAEDSDSKDSETALIGVSKQSQDGKWKKNRLIGLSTRTLYLQWPTGNHPRAYARSELDLCEYQ